MEKKTASLALITAVTSVLAAAGTSSAALLYSPLVTTVGTGATTPSGTGSTTTISQYQSSVANQAAPQSSVSYNSTASGTRLVTSVSGTSEGSLSNNPGTSDAAAKGLPYAGTTYAYSAGYDAAGGTASVNSTATNANRSLGQVTAGPGGLSNAVVLQTQTQATAYNNNNIRGATGDDTGANIYSSGTGGTASTAGWRNFTTNTILTSSPTPTNTRTVELLGGKLYGSTSSGSTVGIYTIDATGATNATPFVTTGTSSDHSPYEFAMFNDPANSSSTQGYNVAYIADDGGAAAAAGGIEKWTYNGTTWALAYILKDTNIITANDKGYRGLAGELDADTGLVTLFATDIGGTTLEQVTDTGAASSFTVLASVPTNDVFRGVALAPAAAPEPASLGILGLCGAAMLMRRRK